MPATISGTGRAMDARFEDFVGVISALNKEIQRVKLAKMRGFGLKGTDVMALYRLAREQDGMTSADLARSIGVDRAAVSRTISGLMQKGLVSAEEDASGIRYRGRVRLTDSGMEIARSCDALIGEIVGKAGAAISPDDREAMYRSLGSILAALRNID